MHFDAHHSGAPAAPLGPFAAERLGRIQARLAAAFAPRELDVLDESHLHAGHAGALTGKGHYRVRIVAAAFDGLPLLARHRAVYAALATEMADDIHALAIDARGVA